MCGYLTKSGTVIIEPLELYDSVIIYEWEGEDD
ncbi:MAG: hypothetical protein A4E23_00059 [Methanomethylovorans sp. PtaU1.Bin073]|nr:MAG: hypothetical protein A4E23_00059 [Methanomethylovorans sp. PtaU1.Bin073]